MLIQLKNIIKEYENTGVVTKVLRGLNLEVEEGLEIEEAPKKGGIFSFFRRAKPVTTNHNALEQILGERPNPEQQEEVENEDLDSESTEIENNIEDQKPEKKSPAKKTVKKEG